MTGGVPLRELLRLGPLAGARVVAGAGGLDRTVRQVNVMEVPDILAWVEPDELLLTTAYPLRDDRAALDRLIPSLAERNLAGLALKPARYIDAIPAEMIEAADRLDFPLIELPPTSSFNEIINGALTEILNAQAARLQRAAEVHDRFTAIVLGGGGLRQIAAALAGMLGRAVVIVDPAGRVQTSSVGGEAIGRVGSILELGDDGRDEESTGRTAARLGDRAAIVQPIRVGRERFGAIIVLGDEPLEDERLDALEYAATIAALRQVQARAVAEADRRFQAICLEELVTGHVDRALLAERALAFGWDLSVPRTVVLVRPVRIADRAWTTVVGTAEEHAVRRRIGEAVRASLDRDAIVWERSLEVGVLLPVPGRGSSSLAAVRGAVGRLASDVERLVPGLVVTVGVGRLRDDPLALAGSFVEARRALEVGRTLGRDRRVQLFDELGVDRLLARLPADELARFADDLLGPLEEYDRSHHGELVATLAAYLETRNVALTARRLFVHYNTLRNRLRTIEELADGSLDDPEWRLALALALRIRRPDGGGHRAAGRPASARDQSASPSAASASSVALSSSRPS